MVRWSILLPYLKQRALLNGFSLLAYCAQCADGAFHQISFVGSCHFWRSRFIHSWCYLLVARKCAQLACERKRIDAVLISGPLERHGVLFDQVAVFSNLHSLILDL